MATTASAPGDKASALSGKGVVAPEILWAQRSSEDEADKNIVMVTINVPNLPPAPATKIDLREQGFHFQATIAADKAHGIEAREYAFDLDLFDKIDLEQSKISQTSKSLYLVLRKKEAKLEYWPRLSKDKIRLHNVKTDFDKWVDEDEQSGDLEDIAGMGDGGMGGMDPSMAGMGGGAGGMDLQAMLQQMQAGGGMGGMGGMPDLSGLSGGEGEDDDEADDDEDDAAQGIEEIKTEGAAKDSD